MAYQSTNPYDGKVSRSFEAHNNAQLEGHLKTAQDCYANDWSQRSFADRQTVLARAAALMRERAQELAALATHEMGKLIQQSLGEVALSAAILDYYASHAEAFLAPEQLDTPKGQAMVESSAIGVVFGVEPWNYPYYQVARLAAPNLMAGNVVMVKHASNVPQCALAFERLLVEAGAPAGAYTNLFISKDQVARVIADPRVRAVALTGSEDGRCSGGGAGRQAAEKVDAGTGRQRCVHRAGRRRPGQSRAARRQRPHGQCRPGLHGVQALCGGRSAG